MGNSNTGNFSLTRFDNRSNVAIDVWTWVDNRHFVNADQIGIGTGASHRPAIGCSYPPNQWRQLTDLTRNNLFFNHARMQISHTNKPFLMAVKT